MPAPLFPRNLICLSLFASLFLVTGCGGTDEDGDGFSPPEDCDDTNAAIFPTADELSGDDLDSNCDGDREPTTGDDDDGGSDSTDPGDFDTTEMVTGDWSCKEGSQEVPPAGASGALEGIVEDFQDEEPVAAARVQLWPGNDPTDSTATMWELESPFTDAEGAFEVPEGTVSACSPFAARVWTEFEPQLTYQTYQVGIIVAGETPFSATFNSVSYATYNLLPLTVGVEPEPGKGIAAGRMTDCLDEPIANAEASVGVVDWATGEITPPDGDYAMRYFVDEDPNGSQNHISDDGLFGAMNVSPGQSLSLLTWGIPQSESHCETTTGGELIWNTDNSALCLLAYSTINVQPDSVNIANVPLKPYPDSCTPSDG